MTTQTISSQSPAYGGYRHHVARHHGAAGHEPHHRADDSRDTTKSQSSQGARDSDSAQSGGTFVRAVFSVFASMSARNAKPATDTSSDNAAQQSDSESTQPANGVVRVRERLNVELQAQDGSEVDLSLQVKAQMNVQSGSASPSDLMQTMQAFASSIFNALNSLFTPSSAQPATQSGTAAAATPATTTASATPASTAQSQVAATSAPPADTTVATTPATSTSSAAETGATSAASNTATGSSSNVKWIGSYLSISARLRILAQHASNATGPDASSGGDPAQDTASAPSSLVPALQQQFSAIQQQLQSGSSSGSTSLADFLHTLADQMNGAQTASISFSLALRGSFVSTSA